MNSKKLISVSLSAALALSLLAIPASAEESFSDVSSTAWYATAVQWAAKSGLTEGDGGGHFLPDSTLTYAQAIQFIYNSKGQKSEGTSDPWYAPAQSWGIDNGYISKDTSMTADCSRLQFVTMLYKAAGSQKVTSSSPFSDTTDAAAIWAYEKGITVGDGSGHFLPDSTLTRAEVVQFLYKENNPSDTATTRTVTGTVQYVSGSQITVAVNGMGGNQAGGQGNPQPGSDNNAAPNGNGMTSGNDSTTPPEIPDGNAMGGSDSTPPAKPDGDTTNGQNGGSAPEMPSGNNANGQNAQPGSMNAQTETITVTGSTVIKDASGNTTTISAVTEGTSITAIVDESGNASSITIGGTEQAAPAGGQNGQQPGGNGGNQQQGGQPGGNGGGQSSGNVSYTAVNEYTSDATISGKTLTSTGADENAVLLDSNSTVTLSNVTISRTSSNSTGGDNSSFYGIGAAALATNGTLNISDSTITTNAAGGAGVFAYGSSTVNVSNTNITTSKDTSGGIHVAGGGTLNATNCTATTSGNSSAAIRSDRGGGTMTVKGGSYTSNGTGSPAVYCTADITVSDATLTANGSEAVCIEGLNSLTLNNCTLSGNMSDDSQNDCTWNIIVYQSMSGDSEVGNGTFSMTGGKLIAKNGGMFYTTNTDSTFYLKNVDITYASDNDFFLRCTGNSNQRGWGKSGSNGANCTFTADSQAMQGNIVYDSISTLKFIMQNGSTLQGAIVDDESCAGNGGNGTCTVTIDSTSKWIVTGNSTVTTLTNHGTIVDASGNTVSIVGTNGTVYVKGTSTYTVTVGSYNA